MAIAIREHTAQFPPAADGTIFTTRFAGPYRHDYYGSLIFSAAVERAGLPKGTTSHYLRHHYASVLLMQGVSVIVVAERLGQRERDPGPVDVRPPDAGLGRTHPPRGR
ncbi:tyrosine-type recombinase/integrase [Micromonospora sp. NBC_00821]|uniref:hypothetical protein n=1 Tax=Micromonospora sp. NBC_00821 TaxID=2975977 RepID=UPI002ED03F39|nr:tyrosine-type recombinase/integrase [Micromonospora sp. NBC_00821]